MTREIDFEDIPIANLTGSEAGKEPVLAAMCVETGGADHTWSFKDTGAIDTVDCRERGCQNYVTVWRPQGLCPQDRLRQTSDPRGFLHSHTHPPNVSANISLRQKGAIDTTKDGWNLGSVRKNITMQGITKAQPKKLARIMLRPTVFSQVIATQYFAFPS